MTIKKVGTRLPEPQERLSFRLIVALPIVFALLAFSAAFGAMTLTRQLFRYPHSPLIHVWMVGSPLLAGLLGALLAYTITKPLKKALREGQAILRRARLEPARIEATNEVSALSLVLDQALVSFAELVVALGLAVAALAPGAYLLDRYDIPSHVLLRASQYWREIVLSVRPILVSDGEVFLDMAASADTPAELKAALGAGEPATAWEVHRRLRAARTFSRAFGAPADPRAFVGRMRAAHPEAWRAILEEADRHVRDEFAPFGAVTGRLGVEFSWTWFPPADDDDLFIWELSRLQHLTWLSQAYLGTGDARYLVALRRHLESWWKGNPVGSGVNWVSTMEVSLRLYTLAWVADLLAGEGDAAALHPALIKSIVAHARHVRQMMDQPRAENNHAIFDAMGLYFAAAAYPELVSARGWRSYAETRLLEELRVQYTARGVHKEYAPIYQLVLLKAYLHYVAVKRRIGEPVAADVEERLKRQLYFLRDLQGPDGRVFLINDSSDPHLLRLAVDRYDDARTTLHLGALLLSIPELASPTPNASWEAKWVLGERLHDRLAAELSAARARRPLDPRRLVTYPAEGMYRVSRGPIVLFGSFARLGYERRLSGHNHSGISSFVLWSGGRPVVIDAGTYTYRQSYRPRGIPWRDYLRSAFAHNTTTVDGLSQAVPSEDFGYLNWPEARLLFAGAGRGMTVVGGEHGAYHDVVGRAVRLLAVRDSGIVLIDWFPDARGRHFYETRLLFDQPTAERRGVAVVMPGARVRWAGTTGIDVSILKGSVDPVGGWASPAYGILKETPQFRGRMEATGPAVLALALDLGPGGPTDTAEQPAVWRDADGTVIVRVPDRDQPLVVALGDGMPELSIPTRLGRWTSDARIAFVTDSSSPEVVLVDGTYLRSPGARPPTTILRGP